MSARPCALDARSIPELARRRGVAADIDAEETQFNSTALAAAIYNDKPRMKTILGAVSRNPFALARMGNVERLSYLFTQEPELAKSTNRNGSLFFALPDDEDRATEVAELLLAAGADPGVRGKDGATAIQNAEKRGLDSVVDILQTRLTPTPRT